jgi:hypothetical protein
MSQTRQSFTRQAQLKKYRLQQYQQYHPNIVLTPHISKASQISLRAGLRVSVSSQTEDVDFDVNIRLLDALAKLGSRQVAPRVFGHLRDTIKTKYDDLYPLFPLNDIRFDRYLTTATRRGLIRRMFGGEGDSFYSVNMSMGNIPALRNYVQFYNGSDFDELPINYNITTDSNINLAILQNQVVNLALPTM